MPQEREQEQHTAAADSNLMNTIRDGIVSSTTNASYTSDIIHLLKWALGCEEQWLTIGKSLWFTEYGRTRFIEMVTKPANESMRLYRSRLIVEIFTLLRKSFDRPIVQIDAIAPEC